VKRATAWCGVIDAEDAVPSPFFACSHSIECSGERSRVEPRKLGANGSLCPFSFSLLRISGSGNARVERALRTFERSMMRVLEQLVES
jgi:hypothetical protein